MCMPKISTVIYSFKQGVRNIKRNQMFSLASIGTMTACLFLFGVFYFALTNFKYVIKNAEQAVSVTVFFEKGTSDAEIKAIGDKIMLRAEVAKCEYISAEEAWENYKNTKLDEEQIASFGEDNPLKDSNNYVVYLNDVEMQDSLVKYISSIPGVRQVNDSEAIADLFSGFNKGVGYVSAGIIIILLGVAVFLISTTVTMGISIRKQEISIMKLIGATDFFIRAPFIVEGIIIGVIGASIPLIFLYVLYHKIINYIMESFNSPFGSFEFISSNEIFSTLIPVSLIIGVGIGFLGSFFTLGKQLRKIN